MFYERLDRFRPPLVRLLAMHEHKHRPMTCDEIAARTGGMLGPWAVNVLSHTPSWDGVEIAKVQAFTRACRCDFDSAGDMRRIEDYLRKGKHGPSFQYLRLSPDWLTKFQPLLIEWRKSYGEIKTTADIWPPLRRLLIRLSPLLKQPTP